MTVSNLPNRMRVAPLTAGAYLAAIDRCSTRGLKSGVIFDALHLIAAERSGAEALLTFNPSDFTRLAEAVSPKIVVPSAPPAETIISSTKP